MESILKKYRETSALVNGYNQMFAMERALGFETAYHLQNSIREKHLINAGDIITVMRWLFANGFDVVKLPKSVWFIENNDGEWIKRGEGRYTRDPLLAHSFYTEAEAFSYAEMCGFRNVTFTEHEFVN